LTSRVQKLEKKLEYEDVAQAVEKGKEKNKFQFNSDIAIDLTPKKAIPTNENSTNINYEGQRVALEQKEPELEIKRSPVTPGRVRRRFTLAKPENQAFTVNPVPVTSPRKDDLDKIFSTPARAHSSVLNQRLPISSERLKHTGAVQAEIIPSSVSSFGTFTGKELVQGAIPQASVQNRADADNSISNEEETLTEHSREHASVSSGRTSTLTKMQNFEGAGTLKALESNGSPLLSPGSLPIPPVSDEKDEELDIESHTATREQDFFFDEPLWTTEEESNRSAAFDTEEAKEKTSTSA
jgi:hypothetical protein